MKNEKGTNYLEKTVIYTNDQIPIQLIFDFWFANCILE